MKQILLIITGLILVACISENDRESAFIMTWDTRNEGYGDSTQIVVPLRGRYYIEWQEVDNKENKGTVKNCSNNTILAFPKPGKYQLAVYGKLSTMNFETYTIDTIPKYGKKEFKLISVDQWGSTIWESFDSFFYNCCSVKLLASDTPNLSQVRSFRQTFCHAENFNSPLDHWNVSNVRDMSYMFYDAWKFNQPINSWNVSNVQTMHSMFYDAYEFNQPIYNWNVSNVLKMSGTFSNAYKFNQNIETWDVSKVETMGGMFNGARSFNQPLEKWNVSNVGNMVLIFAYAFSFNQPLNNWDLASISGDNLSSAFDGAKSFNQPLYKWDVSRVTDISSTFQNASSFNQSLADWKISKDCIITAIAYDDTPTGVFSGTNMSKENLKNTLKSWGRMETLGLFLRTVKNN